MPQGDGTGPAAGQGQERGQGQYGGRGRMGGPFAAGPGGKCVCPKCGYSVAHMPGQPCNQKRCPQCAAQLTRG